MADESGQHGTQWRRYDTGKGKGVARRSNEEIGMERSGFATVENKNWATSA